MISEEQTLTAKSGQLSVRKKLLFAIATLLLFFISAFLAVEIGYRTYKLIRPSRSTAFVFDNTLGWKPKPGKHISLRAKFGPRNSDEAWAEGVESFFMMDENGFRRRDFDQKAGPVIFLLGDSVTEAQYAGIGGTYFDRVSQEFPCRMHVFGSTGYGTLQQTLVLERYISEIRPNIVLLQLCQNDLYDNDPDFASQKLSWVPWRPCPYIDDDGTIALRSISYKGPWQLLLNHSHALRYLIFRFKLVEWRSPFDYQDSPYFASAVERTGRILKRFRNSCGDDTAVLAFATGGEAEEAVFRKLCHEAGITYLEGISGALSDEERKSGNPQLGRHDGPGGHYNLFGHYVIGKALVPHLRQAIESRKTSDAAKPAGK